MIFDGCISVHLLTNLKTLNAIGESVGILHLSDREKAIFCGKQLHVVEFARNST